MEDLHPETWTADSNNMGLRQMLIRSALLLIEKENKCNNKWNNHLKQ